MNKNISQNICNENYHNKGCGNRAPTIGNIIAYFKYQATKQINELQNTSGRKIWQRNYYFFKGNDSFKKKDLVERYQLIRLRRL